MHSPDKHWNSWDLHCLPGKSGDKYTGLCDKHIGLSVIRVQLISDTYALMICSKKRHVIVSNLCIILLLTETKGFVRFIVAIRYFITPLALVDTLTAIIALPVVGTTLDVITAFLIVLTVFYAVTNQEVGQTRAIRALELIRRTVGRHKLIWGKDTRIFNESINYWEHVIGNNTQEFHA